MKNLYQTLFLILVVLLCLSSCRIVKLGQFQFSKNHQRPKQKMVDVANDQANTFRFIKDENQYHEYISNIMFIPNWVEQRTYELSDYLDEETKTTAFVVIRNDTILFEEYYEGYDEDSLLPSWSMAKSFVSALVGIAISEGHIQKSDKVTDYLPQLGEYHRFWNKLTVEHLLNMRSGIDFDEENYSNPFSGIADLYVSKDFTKLLRDVTFKHEPGALHYYSSLDTEILTLVLEQAIKIPLAQYLQEKLWIPMGMESKATWAVDSRKANHTKGFCCLNVTLRDYAKFARLFMNRGNWEGTQLIDEEWVLESMTPNLENSCYQNQWYSQVGYETEVDSSGVSRFAIFKDSLSAQAAIDRDKYQIPVKHWNKDGTWLLKSCGPEFHTLGIFGQEISINPENGLILIRLGKKWDTPISNLFSTISFQLNKSTVVNHGD